MTMIVCVFKCYIRVKIAQVPTNERGKKRLLNNQIIISKHAHDMCRCTGVHWLNEQTSKSTCIFITITHLKLMQLLFGFIVQWFPPNLYFTR